MRLRLKPVLSLCLLLMGGTSLATAQSQSTDIRPYGTRILGDDIASHFKGLTHIGAYNFTQNGMPRGTYKETHNADGTVLYVESGTETHGRWGVFHDILCYYYIKSDVNGGCFRVYQVENCYYFYSNDLPDMPHEIEGDFWTARSTINGETKKCEAAIS